jgi:hypothetical protein
VTRTILQQIALDFQSLAMTISDHGNALVSKIITYLGLASVGVGGAIGFANDTASRITQPMSWGIPDWAAIVSMAAGISLIIKTLVDVYYKIKAERRKDKEK